MEGCGGGFAVGQFSQQAVEDFNAAIGVHVDNSAQQAVVYIFQCCSFYIEHVVKSMLLMVNGKCSMVQIMHRRA